MIRVIILCKAPVPGQVKTRLQPAYTAAQAAHIHAAMATAFIDRVARRHPDVLLAVDDSCHSFFSRFQLRMTEQGDGSLGERLARLLERALSDGADSVLFFGTDSPHMSEARMHYAERYLVKYDVVIGPVEDGGYDLIGVKGRHPELFENISWGGTAVLSETMHRIRSLNLKSRLLSRSYDIDTIADLERALRGGRLSAGDIPERAGRSG